jgi:hypothetical protein
MVEVHYKKSDFIKYMILPFIYKIISLCMLQHRNIKLCNTKRLLAALYGSEM